MGKFLTKTPPFFCKKVSKGERAGWKRLPEFQEKLNLKERKVLHRWGSDEMGNTTIDPKWDWQGKPKE